MTSNLMLVQDLVKTFSLDEVQTNNVVKVLAVLVEVLEASN